MADSDSTNLSARGSIDLMGEMETLQNTMKILNDLVNEHACNWSTTDDANTVHRMVERVIVLSNTLSEKIDGFGKLVSEGYKLPFTQKEVEVAHV